MSETKVELERNYTVPLSRAWIAPRHRRTSRAVNILREFAAHHMKAEEIKIDSKLNEKLWSQGITHPPRRIAVRMTKGEDGVVTILLPKVVSQPKDEASPSEGEEPEEEPAQKDQATAQTAEPEKPLGKTEAQRAPAKTKKSKGKKEKKNSAKTKSKAK